MNFVQEKIISHFVKVLSSKRKATAPFLESRNCQVNMMLFTATPSPPHITRLTIEHGLP